MSYRRLIRQALWTGEEGVKYQMQALAPLMLCRTDFGYEKKSFMITALSFGFLNTDQGRSQRERAMTDVMEESWRHCSRTSRPTKPVERVSIFFILPFLMTEAPRFVSRIVSASKRMRLVPV